MTKVQQINKRLYALLSHEWFFYGTIIFFTLSAVWVATASLYPMAFDEDFHMGLIRIYATSWLPYGIEHTRDMATYGAATADVSYLFHYFMSIPYRLLIWLGASETTTIVVLRMMNIGMAVLAIWLYRKVLFATGLSKPTTHVILAVFTLIPIFTVMAGQVNYDNLLLVIVAFAMLLLVRITVSMRTKRRLPASDTLLFLGITLIGMTIKYAYLPIAFAMVLWLCFVIFYYRENLSVQTVVHNLMTSSRQIKTTMKIVIILLFVSGLFFSGRYIANYAQYSSPIPACDVVFDEDACTAYGPWNRNFTLKNSLDQSFEPVSLPTYVAQHWLPGMFKRLTFAVAGPTNDYQTKLPLFIPLYMLVVIATAGIIYIGLSAKKMMREQTFVWLFSFVTLAYLLPLIWKLYNAYIITGQPVAINGRYLLPLLPFIGATFAIAMLTATRRHSIRKYSAIIASSGLLLFLVGGGGVITYILQAESAWFWPGWRQASHEILQFATQILIVA